MRSGDDTDPNFYWRFTFRGDERSRFATSGEPLTLDRYNRLEAGEKAGISPDNESWEFWTPPLDFDRGHSELVGSRPRRYLQFKADFRRQLGTDIVRQARYIFKGNNSGEISLVLKPEKFGRVRIRMQMEDKSIGGKIFVENIHVREAFTELLDDLKQAFAEQGFENLNLDIDLDNGNNSTEFELQAAEKTQGRSPASVQGQIELLQAYIRDFDSVNILA